MTIPVVIYARNSFYLLNALNYHIANLKSAGLINYWNEEFIDKRILFEKDKSYPRKFNFNDLVGSFYFLLGGFLLSFLTLVFEIILLPYC